jgi:DHA2 family multidrug resistance protein
MVETLQFRRLQTHINVLGRHITPTNPLAVRTLRDMTGLFISRGGDPPSASKQAQAAIWGSVQRQAAMLSYNDVFMFLALMFLAMFPLIFLMAKPKRGGAAPMAH